MSSVRLHTVRLFLICAVMLFYSKGGCSQNLTQPELQFSAPCASDTFNEFHVNFSWDPPLVNPDNQFILELSDSNGSFSNATQLVSYSDKNTIFKFEFVFALPNDVYGENYKVRVRSTNPQMTSPESIPFPAYYLTISDPLVINNFVGTVYSCDGSPVTIKVDNFPNQPAYRWYRNGTYLSSETHSSITTSQSGIYYVELDYGTTCSSTTLSNAVEVVNGQSSSVSILGDSTVSICNQQPYYLEASVDDPQLLYQWYKDDQPVWPLGYYPRLDVNSIGNAEGNWYVEVQRSGGCLQRSNSVTVQYRSLNASLQSLSETILLPGTQIVLEASTDASQPSYSWYKDGTLIANATQQRLTVTQPGTYYAIITETTDCTQEVETSSIVIEAPSDYQVTINTSADYTSCVSLNTQLFIDKILAVMADGSATDIYTSSANQFTYQWYKDGQPISNATTTSLTLNDASENGLYYVAAAYNNINVQSNDETIQLGIASDLTILGETTLEICKQQSYVLQASIDDPSLIYRWYKDDQPVSSEGYYPQFDVNTVDNAEGNWYVEIKRTEGCSLRSNSVTIQYKSINASLQSLSGTVLLPGDQIILEATSNAVQPSYSWFKDDVEIANETQQQLTVTEPGTYYAKITETSDCTLEIATAKITVEIPTGYEISINKSADYASCQSTSTQLLIGSIYAILQDGSQIDIYNYSVDKFTFQWFKDNQPIGNEMSAELAITDASQNGVYYVTASLNDINIRSNDENVELGFATDLYLTSSGSLSCDGSSFVTISSDVIDSGYSYQWYHDGQILDGENTSSIETNESGVYKLEVSAYGCSVSSNDLAINSLDPSLVTIDAGEQITISEGGSATITASGADSYEWYNANTAELLSSNSTLTVTEAGQYVLKASYHGCEITKTVNVDTVESYAVPNVITPNADGYNDKWILPNAYANNSNVEVSIYTLSGKKVIQTYNYRNDWPQSNMPLEKSNGKPLYFYKITKDNNVLKKGIITVID